ncbi:MAG: GNAT family N-acetyltransferase [Oscillospiraceae bacterium]|nr:GNAT family N-acetyltransferase [Oscillospiraceae bacterium]
MNVELVLIGIEHKSVLMQLMELYDYEFTEYDNRDVNEHGYYGYKHIDDYWNEKGRYPYLINVDGKIAGFVLISTPERYSMSEFFVMLKYRRKGVGMQVMSEVFKRHAGDWDIGYWKSNERASKFWKSVVDKYMPDNYQTYEYEDERNKHGGFLFSN